MMESINSILPPFVLVGVPVLIMVMFFKKRKTRAHAAKAGLKEAEMVQNEVGIIRADRGVFKNAESAVSKDEDIIARAMRQADLLLDQTVQQEKFSSRILEMAKEGEMADSAEIKRFCMDQIALLKDVQDTLRQAKKLDSRVEDVIGSKDHELRKATHKLTVAQTEAEAFDADDRREKQRVHHEQILNRKMLDRLGTIVREGKKVKDELGEAVHKCKGVIKLDEHVIRELEIAEERKKKSIEVEHIKEDIRDIEKRLHEIVLALKLAHINEEDMKKLLRKEEKTVDDELAIAA